MNNEVQYRKRNKMENIKKYYSELKTHTRREKFPLIKTYLMEIAYQE